jgi:hypothetical protein
MNFEKQSVLAKLLARENITVQHGAYRTAFFDVERRVLGLPMWKDKGKDVYDLLVGHEVGHALFTPSEGWHDSQIDVEGIPRSYLNVVEDIRIERMVQAKYPGLVGSFKRGYSVLDKDDFFGVANTDVNKLGLMDRLNLKSKLRDLIDVAFSSEEKPYIDDAFNATTWEEVVAAARALYNFVKETNDNDDTDQQEESQIEDLGASLDGENNDTDGDSSNEASSEGDEAMEDSAGSGDEGGPDEGESDQEAGNGTGDTPSPVKPEDKPEESVAVRKDGQDRSEESTSIDPERVITDENFRSKEESLVDTDSRGLMPTVVSKLTRTQLKEMVNTIPEVFAARDEHLGELANTHPYVIEMYEWEELKDAYRHFNIETKKYVNLMAKEFEMRKAAYQSQRAQTARSGSLNVDKLYNYKFTDDVFKRVTNLADAKSHGMVMVIDYSGSMGGVISEVIKQTLTLASFCKKVNIPFDVYSFTSGSNRNKVYTTSAAGQINHAEVKINHLMSSASKKAEFDRCYSDLFAQSFEYSDTRSRLHSSRLDGMGGTPLNETVMAMEMIADDFKKKYNLQKTTIVALTDGAAQNMYIARDENAEYNTSYSQYAITMQNGIVKVSGRYNVTAKLLNYLRKKHTLIGYFLAERNYDFKGAVWSAHDEYVSDSQMSAYRRAYNKNKFVSFENAAGYDKYFVIKSDRKTLDVESDEFEVSENAKKGEIARAFKKFSASKKTNRVFATQFAEAIA